jgi:hypothetical protein
LTLSRKKYKITAMDERTALNSKTMTKGILKRNFLWSLRLRKLQAERRRRSAQQPTANSQQPTANSQQPTANSQQPTANSQQPTANSQLYSSFK